MVYSAVALFDADGVLVSPGSTNVPEELGRAVQGLSVVSAVVSGRTIRDCWRIGKQVGAQAVYGANGLEEQWRGEQDIHVASDGRIVERLRKLLGLQLPAEVFTKEGLWPAKVQLNGVSYSFVVEGGKQAILSLYPGRNETPQGLFVKMQTFVATHQLEIDVVGPHSDGGIDCQPRGFNKTLAVDGILRRAPVPQGLDIFVMVDGINDLQLAEDERVFPITFQNGHPQVKEAVRRRGGIVIPQVGYEGGCLEAVRLIRELSLKQPFHKSRPS